MIWTFFCVPSMQGMYTTEALPVRSASRFLRRWGSNFQDRDRWVRSAEGLSVSFALGHNSCSWPLSQWHGGSTCDLAFRNFAFRRHSKIRATHHASVSVRPWTSAPLHDGGLAVAGLEFPPLGVSGVPVWPSSKDGRMDEYSVE